jgi:menaquinone-9 beta-reductase
MVTMRQPYWNTDVFVVGGGPAGLAAAIAARQEGFQVTVADWACPPIDKACGEGLMPDGVRALEQLGVKLGLEQGVPFHGIRFIEDGIRAEANFLHGIGLGVRRTTLHQALVDRASELGVSLHWGANVREISPQTLMMNGTVVRSQWIIGADGQNSRVRRWASLNHPRYEHLRFGFLRHFNLEPWTDFVEVHWSNGCQCVVTPVSPTEICVAVMTRNPKVRMEEALPLFPELHHRLKGASATTMDRGAFSGLRSLSAVSRNLFVLIGDASGSVDSLAGEGLSMAFQQAVSLAKALASGNLDHYQRDHRRIFRSPALMSRLMLLMDRHDGFRRRVLRALSSQPGIFSRVLAAHSGALPLKDFMLNGAIKLGWGLLTA